MYKTTVAFALIFFSFILHTIYLVNTGQSSPFIKSVQTVPYGDKLGHTILFGVLTVFAIVLAKFRRVNFCKIKIYLGVLPVALFVVVEEFSQIYFPTRTFDWVDLAADGLGIVLAMVSCFLLRKLYLIKHATALNKS